MCIRDRGGVDILSAAVCFKLLLRNVNDRFASFFVGFGVTQGVYFSPVAATLVFLIVIICRIITRVGVEAWESISICPRDFQILCAFAALRKVIRLYTIVTCFSCLLYTSPDYYQ